MGLRRLEAPRVEARRDVHGAPADPLHARGGAQDRRVGLRVPGVQDGREKGGAEHDGHVDELRHRGGAADGRQPGRVGAVWRRRVVQPHGLIDSIHPSI